MIVLYFESRLRRDAEAIRYQLMGYTVKRRMSKNQIFDRDGLTDGWSSDTPGYSRDFRKSKQYIGNIYKMEATPCLKDK